MKRILKTMLVVLLALCTALSMTACNNGGGEDDTTTTADEGTTTTVEEGTTTEEEGTTTEEESTTVEDVIVTPPSREEMVSDLEELNVLALGDSLFYGAYETIGDKVWVNMLGKECGWHLTNLGIGGATVSLTANNAVAGNVSMYDRLFNTDTYHYGSTADSRYYNCGYAQWKTAEEVDVILLEGGCNDYGYKIAAPLGTVESKDPATFLGAWNVITEKLLQDYPNAIIIFITPWELNGSQTRPDNMTSIEFSTSVVTLYEEVYADNDRVYLIDAGDPEVSGVNMNDSTWKNTYSYDNYHLKENGMKIMVESMLPLLWDIVVNQAQ